MSAESKGLHGEGFLSRWSRRKTDARESGSEAVQASPQAPAAAESAPDLPPVEELTLDSDFRGFLHPKVDENVRRAALRKLFSDPHFNVMDGLDTYIDDYSKTEPIPPAMLAGLRQAQRILSWAEGKDDETDDETSDATAHAERPASAGEPLLSGEAGMQTPAIEAVPAEAPIAVPIDRNSMARRTE